MPAMHEIDYQIIGNDMQFVEVELDPGEATVAEAGGMMYMEDGIEMETIFGDGSQQNSGFLGALMGAGKRLLTGESLFMTVFLNRANGKRKLAFGAPYPGKIVAVHLAEIGGELIAQKDSFLAAAKGVSVGIAFQRRLGVGLFGGEGFISEIEILRGDLAQLLVDPARDEVEYVFGDTISELSQDEHGVDVTFAHRAPARFDLVVGADGLHSTVRRLAFGPERDFVRHLGVYVATMPLGSGGALRRSGAALRSTGVARGGEVVSLRLGELPERDPEARPLLGGARRGHPLRDGRSSRPRLSSATSPASGA